METPDEIWVGDLFGRREEAESLIGYLENVVTRPLVREDGHAHVLAVDSVYGRGKSYFLRRLDRHLRATGHVSAYVDAWVDDLEDEPIVALAATLEAALAPWCKSDSRVEQGFADFKAKAGRVAKIVGVGLAKRGLGLAITQAGAEALSDELATFTEDSQDRIRSSIGDASTEIITDAADEIAKDSFKLMDERIKRFRSGQLAIREIKVSLSNVVTALQHAGLQLPIVIIIDELDRCRPTYAIKLLEEVKHLFDVSGVSFILGLHSQQLSHSISAAYGNSFDGSAYLRRFFNRRYVLRESALTLLIQHLIVELDIPVQRLNRPSIKINESRNNNTQIPPVEFISDLFVSYGVTARDAFSAMEMLQTCLALTAPSPLIATYIIPLIVSYINSSENHLPKVKNEPNWTFMNYIRQESGNREGQWVQKSLSEMVEEIDAAVNMNRDDLLRQFNRDGCPAAITEVSEVRFNMPKDSLANPQNYRRLLETVSRFRSD